MAHAHEDHEVQSSFKTGVQGPESSRVLFRCSLMLSEPYFGAF